ncbi:prostaglandin D2 receptor [Macrosteles quadrilineatus]|uniref:prostaglandin D2 receptor n=1 Tax=Macrosteles quadrilineatus TaxID=74068 RepID=UPI0023E30C5F|nr:prostaglandin D2 receptor [Macrosteles quadrilineatus]
MDLPNGTLVAFVSGFPRRNYTLEVAPSHDSRHLSVTGQVIITAFYLVGLVGNLAALGFLYRSESKPRNPKHALMLRCLAANDLVAILGMMTQMNLQLYFPALAHSRSFCQFRVVWRIFGLGSGCVAIVMAIERWFAFTRPFFYQKHVTTTMIRRAIFSLWSATLVLVCLPFLGFGLYFEPQTAKCVRYRLAKRPVDIAYAYLFLSFGFLLCLCIVWCNLAVMCALCRFGRCDKSRHPITLPRRISRNQSLTFNACTREEMAFARLMALLCVVFVLCWMPQMISIPMAQVAPKSTISNLFFRLADVLMLLHFTLDPYLYVLQRWPFFRGLCGVRSRNNSIKNSHEISMH